MPHLRQRGKRWQVAYRDPTGKQRSKSFSSKKAADKYAGQVLAAKDEGTWRDPVLGKLKLREAAARYEQSIERDLRPGTRKNHEQWLRNRILPEFGDWPVAQISSEAIRDWWIEQRQAGVSEGTLNQATGLLARILDQCVEDRRIITNPVPKTGRPRQTRAPEKEILTPAELRLLADTVKPPHAALVWTLGTTALRWGEAAGLRPDCVNLDRREIRVVRGLSEINGKRSWTPPKTERGRRTVPIPESVLPMIAERLADGHDTVFRSTRGSLLSASNWRQYVWLPAIETIGRPGITVHSLRHTAASFWLHAGLSLAEVSRLLGHASVGVTADVYSHALDGFIDRGRDAMDALLAADNVTPIRRAG